MTESIALYLGIFSVVLALSMIIRRKMTLHIVKEMVRHRAMLYLIGLIEFAAGLVVVFNHNIWSGGALTLIVTIFGWLLVVEGAMYLFIKKSLVKKMADWLHNKKAYYLLSLAYLIFGILLISAAM